MSEPYLLEEGTSYDTIVIGAGGAGMCLLLAMHEQGYLHDRSVLILEPSQKNTDDRTWCFWAKSGDAILSSLGVIVSNSWSYAWSEDKRHALQPYQYFHLRSSDFYAYVKSILQHYPNVVWRYERAGDTGMIGDSPWVEVGAQRFAARWVYDSRISSEQRQCLESGAETVWQSFVGWRLRFSEPLPDSEAIRLMDFSVEQDGFVQFVYVLPTSEYEALIEITRFGVHPIERNRAEELLEAWVEQRYGSFTQLESEVGVIPMSLSLNAQAPVHPEGTRIIPIGTAAGAVKGSTGYALQRMHMHAQGIVQALVQNEPCPTPFKAARFEFYDALLLHILTNKPALGKRIFQQLFTRVRMPSVLAFLDEKTKVQEEIPILLSLPVVPFLQALDRVYIRPAMIRLPALAMRGVPLLATLLALLLQFLWPETMHWIVPALLLGGMVFPGIPHGAVDHHLSALGRLRGRSLLRFVVLYLGIMGLVLLLWMFSPILALSAFLLYSAWHFGETDLRHWMAFSSWRALPQGAATLGIVLFSHPEEFQLYLQLLGLGTGLPAEFAELFLYVSIGVFLWMGLFIPPVRRRSWMQTLLVLAGGMLLPLLLAFGLYFIGVHSWRGWRHLQAGLSVSSVDLWRRSLPFSLGAYALFVLLLVARSQVALPFEGVIPGLFVFLAAISAPHIWFMHRFYQ